MRLWGKTVSRSESYAALWKWCNQPFSRNFSSFFHGWVEEYVGPDDDYPPISASWCSFSLTFRVVFLFLFVLSKNNAGSSDAGLEQVMIAYAVLYFSYYCQGPVCRCWGFEDYFRACKLCRWWMRNWVLAIIIWSSVTLLRWVFSRCWCVTRIDVGVEARRLGRPQGRETWEDYSTDHGRRS